MCSPHRGAHWMIINDNFDSHLSLSSSSLWNSGSFHVYSQNQAVFLFISHLWAHPQPGRRGVTMVVLFEKEFLVEMMSRTHAGGFALVLSGCIRTGSTGFRIIKAGSLIKETDSTQWQLWLFCLNVLFVMVRTGNKRPEIPMKKKFWTF